jgi:hypothetical protein
MKLNNARLLVAVRYQGSLSDYQAVLDKLDGRLSDALAVYAEAAARTDSREFLRAWALEH